MCVRRSSMILSWLSYHEDLKRQCSLTYGVSQWCADPGSDLRSDPDTVFRPFVSRVGGQGQCVTFRYLKKLYMRFMTSRNPEASALVANVLYEFSRASHRQFWSPFILSDPKLWSQGLTQFAASRVRVEVWPPTTGGRPSTSHLDPDFKCISLRFLVWVR